MESRSSEINQRDRETVPAKKAEAGLKFGGSKSISVNSLGSRTREPFFTFVTPVITAKLPWETLFFPWFARCDADWKSAGIIPISKLSLSPLHSPITLCQRNFIYNADYRTFGRRETRRCIGHFHISRRLPLNANEYFCSRADCVSPLAAI